MAALKGTIKRLDCAGETVTMTQGLAHESYQEPRFLAIVYDRSGRYVAQVSNGTTLCLPKRSVRASEATDQEILDAVLGDEHVFGPDYGRQGV